MLHTGIVMFIGVLLVSPTVAAQAPCTTDARRIVDEIYRHLLGRQPDPAGARAFAEVAVTRGVDAVIDEILASPEYRDAFGDTGVPGSGGLRYCASERAERSPAGSSPNGEMIATATAPCRRPSSSPRAWTTTATTASTIST